MNLACIHQLKGQSQRATNGYVYKEKDNASQCMLQQPFHALSHVSFEQMPFPDVEGKGTSRIDYLCDNKAR